MKKVFKLLLVFLLSCNAIFAYSNVSEITAQEVIATTKQLKGNYGNLADMLHTFDTGINYLVETFNYDAQGLKNIDSDLTEEDIYTFIENTNYIKKYRKLDAYMPNPAQCYSTLIPMGEYAFLFLNITNNDNYKWKAVKDSSDNSVYYVSVNNGRATLSCTVKIKIVDSMLDVTLVEKDIMFKGKDLNNTVNYSLASVNDFGAISSILAIGDYGVTVHDLGISEVYEGEELQQALAILLNIGQY